MRKRCGVALLALACAAWIACGHGASEQQKANADQTREIMGQIFGEIRQLLPLSVRPGQLADPANRDRVTRSLATLSRNSALLEDHAGTLDAQMHYLAGSIVGDAREVQRAYHEERFDRAAFLLQQITENCVVCHTRLPSKDDSALSEGFVAQEVFDELDLESRAVLQIATRRFDAALDTLEELLTSSSRSAVTMIGPLTDYLVVSIRVKGDYARPIPTLARFAARPDLWTQLRAEVESWLDALPRLQVRAAGEPDLATARALLEEGREMVDFGPNRTWLVHLVVASAILERFIAVHPEPDPELAEAYFWLGITEARVGRNYWVTAAPFLLETAIRMAPQERFAGDAFALLEQELLMSYEGSDYEEIPPEQRAMLEELEALMARP